MPRTAATIATSHHVVAGTSLMGHISWNRNGGLTSSARAASRPAGAPPRIAPSRKVSQTASAPSSGTTQKTAVPPAAALNAAITIGSPGA
ncbi:MAG: hypothetical protein A3I61_14140 [Acidobacteria bacterium RIFCSPLOWO2_02_FULL_68_18]|nr:MAG: hypothetical protein A3I61_14140 [Acidobacteria bacterium RIFCSPLOWO2_02_FULL_68_18]